MSDLMDEYIEFLHKRNAAKGNKELKKQLEYEWFLKTKGDKYSDWDGKGFNNYAEAIEGAKLENNFEKMLRNEIESIYKIDQPYYIKWVTRKRAAYNGSYTMPGSRIEICQARHFYWYGEHKGEIDMDKLRHTLFHEYAHYVERWISNWDNKGHGDVFQAVLFNLEKLAKKKGLVFKGGMDIDEDHFHNKMKACKLYVPVCERMGLDPDEMCNDKDIIVSPYPNNFDILVY